MAVAIGELRQRFCGRSLDRLSAVEANWWASQGAGDLSASEAILREIHTIKGDADMLGFVDVRKLCAAIESMVSAAASRGFDVAEDLNLLVSMAIQFTTMLLQSPEAKLGGIDVDGFVAQTDALLERLARMPAADPLSPSSAGSHPPGPQEDDRLSPAALERLSIAATTAFLEMVNSAGESRRRLAGIWQLLRAEIVRFGQTTLAEELEPHVLATEALALRQGKKVRVVARIDETVIARRALDAVNTAAVHVLRNAVDHGIEAPSVRSKRGKPETGTISLSARHEDHFTWLTIEDDGAGVDLAAVRRAGEARGLMVDGAGLDLLFQGVTLEGECSDVSSRGVGLGAVKQMVERIGGTVRLTTTPGKGTSVTLTFPAVARTIAVHRFAALGSPIDFAVTADWEVEAADGAGEWALDPVVAVGIRRDWSRADEGPTATLTLRRNDRELTVLATSPPERVCAQRPCPTGAAHAAEIVEVGGTEVVLLRPELLSSSTDRPGMGRNPLVMGRTSTSLLLRCDLALRGSVTRGIAVVASPTTAFVDTDRVVQKGDTVGIELSFPGLLDTVSCAGRVVSRHVQSNPGEPRGLLLSLDLGASGRRLLRALEAASGGSAPWSVLVASRTEPLRVSFPAVLSRMDRSPDGLVVQTAGDAESVLQLTRDGEYDLVIVDTDLEDEAGSRLLVPLRRRPARQRPHVVVIAPDDAAKRAAMFAAGADMVIPKPVAAHQLLDTIRRLLAAKDRS